MRKASRGPPAAGGATLGEALASLDARLFVGREQELDVFRAWLTTEQNAPGLVYLWGPGGSGKSALLRAFARVAEAAGRHVVFVDGRDVRPEPAELAVAIGVRTLDTAVTRLNASRAVVLLDTFELLVDLTRVLQREVLPKLGPDVRLVIAGRHPLGLAWGAWRQIVRELPLGGLAPAEVRAYLARRDIHNQSLIDQMVAAAGGLPLALSLVADLVLQSGVRDLAAAPEWHRLVRSLVEELLEDVRDPVLRELLEAAAVVRQFDEALLTALSDRADTGPAFSRLCHLSIVQPGRHGLLLHDDIRHILVQDLRWRQPERYAAIRMRALAHYRDRMRKASPSEREWLLAERLALWENAFVQAMLFTEAEVGRVWLDWGRAEDHPELMRTWTGWIQLWLAKQMRVRFDPVVELAATESVLAYRAARVRVARDRDNHVVGFSTALPVCQESVPVLLGHPATRATIDAFVRRLGSRRLPTAPDETNAYFFCTIAHTETESAATRQALIRDVFGLFARGGVYLIATPIPAYKALFETLGFERLPEAQSWFYSDEHPEEGFLLDLTRFGVEPWIEAIIAGHLPPRMLSGLQIERALHEEVLPHWHDDLRIASSSLANRFGTPDQAPHARAAAVRSAVTCAMTNLLEQATRDRALALRALEAAYLEKHSSHERVAEVLAVSRSTLYRMVRRGVHELAMVLDVLPPDRGTP